MKYTLQIIILLFITSCATVGTVPGGDQDITPPKVLSSNPDSAQLNFTGNRITLVFNEYFNVKNFNKEILISPPPSKPPTYKVKKKTLSIDLNDTLKSNTTYQINLGNAIVDNNEGNVLNNYTLTFCTGSTIDTGYLSGYITSSNTGKPISKMRLHLIIPGTDSNLLTATPYYIALSKSDGSYRFNHINTRPYNIVAILDNNFNQQPDDGELIAFLPYDIEVNQEIYLHAFTYYNPQLPFIISSKQISANQVELTWNKPIRVDQLNVKSIPSSFTYNKEGYLPVKLGEESSKTTVYTDSSFSTFDSVQFIIYDQLNAIDTFTHKPIKITSKTTLTLEQPLSKFHSNRPVSFKSNHPILKTLSKNITLIDPIDSTVQPIKSIKIIDHFELQIETKLKEGHSYKLILDSNSIHSYPNISHQNDTISFSTYKSNDLGTVEISIKVDSLINSKHPIYICLINESYDTTQNIVPLRQILIKSDTILSFKELIPGKYIVYAYSDVNNNQTYDNGNFYKNRLPEPKYFLKTVLDVRANWENKNISFLIN